MMFTGCGGGEEPAPAEESKTAVEARIVESSSIKSELVYAGQVKPNETVNVTSKISGQVSKVNYDVGDTVKAGSVMFTLNQKDIQDQIKNLQAQLNVSNASVKSAQTTLNHVDGAQSETQELSLKTAVENAEKSKENADVQIKNAQVAIETADANIKSSNVSIENAQISIKNAQTSIENSKATLDNATEKYNNMKILYNAGTITKNDFDAAELAYTQAQKAYTQAQNSLTQARNSYTEAQNSLSKAQISKKQAENSLAQANTSKEQTETAYNQAKENYDIYVNKTTGENRETAQAGVNSAVASRQSVQTQINVLRSTLNDTSVKAPISGVITEKNISETNMVSSQSAPFVIVDMSKVTVDVNVSERLINVIKPGDIIDVTIPTVGDAKIKGKIKTITPSADKTNTYPVKIEIDNADGTIKPGMFAEIHFVESKKDDTIVVPRNTVVESADSKYVYVIEDNKAVKKEVETGIDNGNEIEIVSGVSFGENVIVKGQSYVNDGEEVNIVGDGSEDTDNENQTDSGSKEE